MWWLWACILGSGGGPTGPGESDPSVDPPGETPPGEPPAETADTTDTRDTGTITSSGTGGEVIINEVQPKNDSTWQDESGALPDWVELLNVSDETVDLARVTLTEPGGIVWRGSGTLEPGEHTLVLCETGANPLPFSLSNEGGTISLALDGAEGDVVTWGDLPGDTSGARFPDGGAFAITGRPTPGETNGTDPGITDPSEDIFQTEWVHEVRVELPDASLESLEDDGSDEVIGSITFEGITFPAVSVRIKGGSGSLTEWDEKPALKIDLDDYAQHRLRGLEKLTLNNVWQDPTAMHEWLSYEQLRTQGLPAPRVGYAWLVVNGEDYGLFTWVESVDDQFLERWFADPTGNLYEGSYGTDLSPGSELDFEYDEGADPDDRSDLTRVIDVLTGTPDEAGIAALKEVVDLDEVLAVLAWEAAAVHFDGYSQANNYRLYHDPTSDRFALLPWGTDRTYEEDRYGVWDGLGLMFRFCIENDACRSDYERAIEAAATHMEGLDLQGEMDRLDEWLAPWIDDDDRLHWDGGDHEDAMDAARDFIAARPALLRDSL
jgi:hypothetical protein